MNRSPLTIGLLLLVVPALGCAESGARVQHPRGAFAPDAYESMVVVHGMLARTLEAPKPEDDIAKVDDELADTLDDKSPLVPEPSLARAKVVSVGAFEEAPVVTWGTPALYGQSEPAPEDAE